MQKKSKYNVAIVGATGVVGSNILKLLEERKFPVNTIKLLSSARSKGIIIKFKGKDVTVEEAAKDSFKEIDIAFFSAGSGVSKDLVQHAVKCGAMVIDNTSAFRMDEDIPLIVPEVNPSALKENNGLIANPNCSTIQMVVALKPIYDNYGIKQVVVSTYQAVSGAGTAAIDETIQQSRQVLNNDRVDMNVLPVGSLPVKKQIAFNAIPQIDKFTDNGFTLEELKMINETKKILDDDNIKITATCVRVPVIYGHSESVYLKLDKDFKIEDIKNLLASAPGITLIDNPKSQEYPTAVETAGKLPVFVGRVRKDLDNEKGLNLWIVTDNLVKGAAWNAVQIAELIVYDAK